MSQTAIWGIRVNISSLVSGDHGTFRALLWIEYFIINVLPFHLRILCVQILTIQAPMPGLHAMLGQTESLGVSENQVSGFESSKVTQLYGSM